MKKAKAFGVLFLIFITAFLFISVFFSFCLVCINKFIEISSVFSAGQFICFLVLVSIMISLCVFVNLKRLKNTKFSFWLGGNYPKLLIGFILLCIATASISNTVIWTSERVERILSIQWTIFGLSITIFLVWKVLMVDFLKKAQPQNNSIIDYVQRYKFLEAKRSFSQDIELTFSTLILLTFNLFLLLLSTIFIYMIDTPESIFTQNVTRCSFYFTTNTIASLFVDILKPLKKDKADLIKENTVTKEELDQAKANAFLQMVVDGVKNAIMDSDKYTDNEKKEMLEAFLDALREAASKKDELKAEGESEDMPSAEDISHGKATEL